MQQLQSGGEGPLGTLRRSLGLDTLGVGSSDTGDATLAAGKYINDRVYLQVEQGLTPESGKARVQVDLTPNISAYSEINQNAQTGVRLQWRYDY